jgi:hypothetical protein
VAVVPRAGVGAGHDCDKALFQSVQFFGMLLGDFFRGRRRGTVEFARGLLHRGLYSILLLLYHLLMRNLLVTYPSAKLFLSKPASVIYKIDLQPAYIVTFDIQRQHSASLYFSTSSHATYKEEVGFCGDLLQPTLP